MRFGVNFFPTIGPLDKPASRYYAENLRLAVLADRLGLDHIKTVEHYFLPYGGYSPDPVTFLAAVAARTTRIRIVTGAVIPAFSHPIKLAGKLAMLDNLSEGRLDVGFGRAFLPDEFAAFQIPMDSSRARFEEGVTACQRLWSQENVIWDGEFYQFGPVTLLPRPYQEPHPRIFVATAFSVESCENAGSLGRHLLLVPSIGTREQVTMLLESYRKAWDEAGHEPGGGQVHMSYTCYLADDRAEALRLARVHEANYLAKLTEAVHAWGRSRSASYPGYERLVEQVGRIEFEQTLADTKVLVGTPDDVCEQLSKIAEWYGHDVTLSLQVNPGTMDVEDGERTVRLLARHVMPAFAASTA